MKNKSEKGFTLIELIAAIAILFIGLVGTSLSFNSSSKIFSIEKNNLELVSNNQSIAQNIKEQGKDKVETIFTYLKANVPPSNACYIYFDNYDEIKNTIASSDLTVYKIASNSKGYSECLSKKTGTKKYGAMIEFSDVAMGGVDYPSYKLYNLKITVWNLEIGENSKSQTTLYIGR